MSDTISIGLTQETSNPCIRCGKERIISKTWKESVKTFIGSTIVTYTETVCPDSDCQKIVEHGLAVQKNKREKLEKDKEIRKLQLKKSQKNLNSKKKNRKSL